jgi:hypothetical protein
MEALSEALRPYWEAPSMLEKLRPGMDGGWRESRTLGHQLRKSV